MANEQIEQTRDPRGVFVIHGRHERSREAMFAFLTALGLQPLEWSYLVRLTGKGSPYVGEVLDAGFKRATAAVVLFTPDDEAKLRPQFRSVNEPVYETILTGHQARQNVIFEAGMALGIAPDHTILVEFGTLRPISDLSGRHAIRINNSERRRKELAERLETAGCIVDLTGSEWKMAGDFDGAIEDLQQLAESDSVPPIDLVPGYTVESSGERGQLGNDAFEISYLQIQGLADSYIQRRINSVLEREFKGFAGLVDDQGQLRDPADDFEDAPVTSSWLSYEVGLTTSVLISFRADRCVDFGGAHPINEITGFVFDVSSAYRYSLHDLFRSDQNYKGILRAHIQGSLNRDLLDDPDWSDNPPQPDEGTPRSYDFYFSERELVIVNVFSAHAFQGVWARIPFSDIANIADPQGPLFKLVASRSAEA